MDVLAVAAAALAADPQSAASHFACAECGTTTATTYVVTTLDPDDESTRTEVCRDCDDQLRTPEGLPALVYADESIDSYLDHVASMQGWSVTVTQADGETVETHIVGAGYGDDNMATLHFGGDLSLVTEDVRQVFIH